ncbi:MAG: hypothetical protein RJB34_738 [Pseudomonadota bacterium]|jgi:hypothetical protein
MLTVIETPIFQSMAADVWTQTEREQFAVYISENPLSGDVIAQTGGLRKLRWTRQGMGKRGGARVIYYTRLSRGEIVLIAVYVKAKFDNLPVQVLKSWKEAYDEQS